MFKKILVGIDGTESTENVVGIAADLARHFEAELHVVCAVDPAYFLDEPDGARPTPVDEIDYPAAAIEREGADSLVRQTVLELRARAVNAFGSVVPGEPVTMILETAHKLACDTIVLGHRHLSWLGRLTERSVCHELLEKSPIPVLVVPAEPAPASASR